mmetsp:Transcript_21497/g.68520  ORF Transcript_21497/g.68520 Transcript_21497/m.68520 type:complete len:309 (-) Transcript_21497:445-1371(-)
MRETPFQSTPYRRYAIMGHQVLIHRTLQRPNSLSRETPSRRREVCNPHHPAKQRKPLWVLLAVLLELEEHKRLCDCRRGKEHHVACVPSLVPKPRCKHLTHQERRENQRLLEPRHTRDRKQPGLEHIASELATMSCHSPVIQFYRELRPRRDAGHQGMPLAEVQVREQGKAQATIREFRREVEHPRQIGTMGFHPLKSMKVGVHCSRTELFRSSLTDLHTPIEILCRVAFHRIYRIVLRSPPNPRDFPVPPRRNRLHHRRLQYSTNCNHVGTTDTETSQSELRGMGNECINLHRLPPPCKGVRRHERR